LLIKIKRYLICNKNVEDESANKLTSSELIIAYNGKMPTNNMIKLRWSEYTCLWICKVDAQIVDWLIDPSIRIKWTPQQDEKPNAKQQNDALRRQNHEEEKT
jgi:hypothetical protein